MAGLLRVIVRFISASVTLAFMFSLPAPEYSRTCASKPTVRVFILILSKTQTPRPSHEHVVDATGVTTTACGATRHTLTFSSCSKPSELACAFIYGEEF